MLLEGLKTGGREEVEATIINGRVENVAGATESRYLRGVESNNNKRKSRNCCWSD